MGFDLGALLRGTAGGITAYSQGKRAQEQARQEMERQARRDLLAESLLRAQAENQRSLAQQRRRRKAPTTVFTDQGLMQFDEESGAWVPAQIGSLPVGTRLRRPEPRAPREHVPVIAEKEKATFGGLALRANNIANRLEAADPTIGARVAKKLANTRGVISALGHRLAGMSQDEIDKQAETRVQSSMTPEELEYYHATAAYMGQVLPGRSGKAVTGREWLMQAPTFFATGEVTPNTVKARSDFRLQQVQGMFREAGSAADPVLEALRGAGLDLTPYGFAPAGPQPPVGPQPPRASERGKPSRYGYTRQ